MKINLRGKKSVLETYLLNNTKAPLILIMPGGGYDHTSPREGKPVAEFFNKNGYHAAVLHYREELYPYPEPTYDIAASVKYLWENKDEFMIDEIITMGFSAGGHATALYNCKYQEFLGEDLKCDIIIKRTILCYPVITDNPLYAHQGSFINLGAYEEVSIEKLVDENFPKTFIWHTVTDESVPVYNSLLMMKALSDKNVNYEAHIYPRGPHGVSLAIEETAAKEEQNDPYLASWSTQVLKWLEISKG